MALLEIRDLKVVFTRRDKAPVHAVDGLNLDVDRGQTVGLVGESGCGKSVTSLAILGLLPTRGVEVSGTITFDGEDLLTMSDTRRREVRGRDIAMIFQDPMTSLNPVLRVGVQLTETLRRHRGMSTGEARVEAQRLLEQVGIPAARQRLGEFPHQLSGGMRQRVLIAIALACSPKMLIADEPTTALDVTVQAQILDLLRTHVADSATALVMITHDMGVVAGICDEVSVMYAGRRIEAARCYPLFEDPRHWYTKGLLASAPTLERPRADRLSPIPGSAQDRIPWAQGCAFAPRCPAVTADCLAGPPPMVSVDDTHQHRCVNPAQPHSGPAPADKELMSP
ncbi:MAG: ABC transporter ATP-binding protein [Intrasporangium sp.]|uniref:ABC transporter ATP-binding protein n=1 Tax=Intrasporangium sp. TaxID=1925024 RepID=UPI0026491B6C|nr:ABC transporter ATP-binding protein [Intrasporangium sp.]MDN5796884.1 ABC transporter ATP-binding protein [Intrasporangium sp.]